MNVRSRCRILLPVLALLLALPCAVAAETAQAVLDDMRMHGIRAPSASLARLQSVEDPPGKDAPQDLRRRYLGSLAALQLAADDDKGWRETVAALEAMAAGGCEPCRLHVHILRASAALRRQDVQVARLHLQQAEARPTPQDPELKVALLWVRGVIHDISGDHLRAVEAAAAGAELAMRHGLPAEQVRMLNLLMLANLALGDLPRSQKAGDEAFALAERIGYRHFMVNLRGNQALMHGVRGEFRKQKALLEDALRIARSAGGMAEVEAITLGNLAHYHLERGEYSNAIARAREAMALAGKVDQGRARGLASLHLGRALVASGAVAEGVRVLEDAARLQEQLKLDGDRADTLLALAEIHEKAGRYREALALFRQAQAVRDGVSSREREQAAMTAQEQFSATRKDFEIQRLSLENARRLAEIEARTWRQRLWAALAALLLVATVPLYRGLRRMRARNLQLQTRNQSLAEVSSRDPLTGAYNRRHCQALMGGQEAARTADPGGQDHVHGTGLILLDLDFFKHVNDAHGHAAGDAVLVETTRRLRGLLRQQDAIVRWGGEEFLVLLPNTPARGVAVLAERVLEAIGAAPYRVADKTLHVTASLGCVSHPVAGDMPWEDAVQIADLALYLSKSNGRNRATCLMEVDPGVQPSSLLSDLRAAQATGEARLQTIAGPAVGDAS